MTTTTPAHRRHRDRKKSSRKKRVRWSTERLQAEWKLTLREAVSKGSRRTYSSACKSYLKFCELHEIDPTPTTETLSLYIVYESAHIRAKSVRSYLSGICNELEEDYPHIRDVRMSAIVAKTMKGALKRRNTPPNRKDPLRAEDVERIIKEVINDTATYDDLLFCAILAVGFTTLQRLGELTVPDKPEHREYRKIPMRFTAHHTPDGLSYTLPFHKADTFFEGSTIFVPNATILPGIPAKRLLAVYIQYRDSIHKFLPELWLRQSGIPPTRSWFLARLRKCLPDEGNIGGHSIRSGGATALALAGVQDSRIQTLGRWASNTFQIYIRKHPLLLHALQQSDPRRSTGHARLSASPDLQRPSAKTATSRRSTTANAVRRALNPEVNRVHTFTLPSYRTDFLTTRAPHLCFFSLIGFSSSSRIIYQHRFPRKLTLPSPPHYTNFNRFIITRTRICRVAGHKHAWPATRVSPYPSRVNTTRIEKTKISCWFKGSLHLANLGNASGR